MKNQHGFTLIELVIIIVLLAIIAAVAIPMMGDETSMKAAATAEKLKSDIRYAQELAMTRNRRTRVDFNGGLAPAQGYAVAIDNSVSANCSSFAVVADPSGRGNLSVTLNTGGYRGIQVSANCLEYNSLGQPYTCGAGVCSNTASGSSITVSPGGYTITVSAETGAVN